MSGSTPGAARMTTLTAVLTHLGAPMVDEQLELLSRIAPAERFVVCHGGRRQDFEAVRFAEKAFVDDPTLRGAPRSLQSYHVTFDAIWRTWVADDPSIAAVYLIEYDHLVLRGDFATALGAVAHQTGAGLLGKDAFARNATNWEHYGRFRRDPVLRAHLRGLSVRAEPDAIFGTLGNGMWLSRAALESYVAVSEHPPCYGELYVPTLLHHLGHEIVDLDAVCDLYAHVRWEPPYDAAPARALLDAGATFIHPIKDRALWRDLALAAAQNASEPSPLG
jgi:hypothetical protein